MMQDASDFYTFDLSGAPITKEGPPKAKPTLGEVWDAARVTNRTDRLDAPERRFYRMYEPVIEAIRAIDPDIPLTYAPPMTLGGQGSSPTELRVWAFIMQRRKSDPGFLKEWGKDRAEFYDIWRKRDEAEQAKARDTLDRSRGFWAGATELAAGVWESGLAPMATSPETTAINMVGGGGGKHWAARVATEALAAAGATAATQPSVARNRKAEGQELTGGEALANILTGGAAAGALQGAGEVGGWAFEKWLGKRLRDTVGEENLTPEQRAAADVLDREDEIAETSPFTPGAGTEAHVTRMAEANAELNAPRAARRAPREAAAPAPVPRETSAPVPQAMPREQFMARVRRQESGGDDAARNPKSTATGRYQFVDDTWLRYHKRVIGGGMSDAQRLAQRTDGAVQERLMRALTADNAAALAREGVPETAGNLYLMHFAGQGGAGKILRAAPDTPIEQLLKPEAIRANPFLRGKSASDVIRWAHRAMGEEPHAGPVLRRDQYSDDAAGDEAWAAAQRAVDEEEAYRLSTQRRLDDMLDEEWPLQRGRIEMEPWDPIDPNAPARGVDWEPEEYPVRSRGGELVDWARAHLDRGPGLRPRERWDGTLSHPALGDIAVRWGRAGDPVKDFKGGYGLAHILAKHPNMAEMLDELPRIIAEMEVVENKAGRMRLEGPEHDATVRLDWDEKTDAWLLTAFEREQALPRGEAPAAPVSGRDAAGDRASPDLEATGDIGRTLPRGKPGQLLDLFWANARDAGVKARPVWAITDADGTIKGWSVNKRAAEREMATAGIDDVWTLKKMTPPPAALPPSVEAMRGFDTPETEAAARQADSLIHDARIRAEAEPGRMVRIDAEGEERALKDVLDEIEADAAAIEAIRKCL